MGNSNLTAEKKMKNFTFVIALLSVAALATIVEAAHPGCKYAVAKNMRCGARYKTRCPPKTFCSRWGWCGTSALHKKTHQALFDGRICKAAKKRVVKKKAVKKVKKVAKKGACRYPVSRNGRCGRRHRNTRCAGVRQFCSRWGWCGTSRLHKRTQQKLFNGRRCGEVVKRSVKRKRAVKRVVKRFRFKKGAKRVARTVVLTMRYLRAARIAWRARVAGWRYYLKWRRTRNFAKRRLAYRRFRVLRWRHIKAKRVLRLHKLRVRRRYRLYRIRMRKVRSNFRLARRIARKSKYAKKLKRRATLRIRRFVAKRRVFRRLIRKVRRVSRRSARIVWRRRMAQRRRWRSMARKWWIMIRRYRLSWRKA